MHVPWSRPHCRPRARPWERLLCQGHQPPPRRPLPWVLGSPPLPPTSPCQCILGHICLTWVPLPRQGWLPSCTPWCRGRPLSTCFTLCPPDRKASCCDVHKTVNPCNVLCTILQTRGVHLVGLERTEHDTLAKGCTSKQYRHSDCPVAATEVETRSESSDSCEKTTTVTASTVSGRASGSGGHSGPIDETAG